MSVRRIAIMAAIATVLSVAAFLNVAHILKILSGDAWNTGDITTTTMSMLIAIVSAPILFGEGHKGTKACKWAFNITWYLLIVPIIKALGFVAELLVKHTSDIIDNAARGFGWLSEVTNGPVVLQKLAEVDSDVSGSIPILHGTGLSGLIVAAVLAAAVGFGIKMASQCLNEHMS